MQTPTTTDDEFRKTFRAQDATDLTEVGLIRRSQVFLDAFEGRLPLQREMADINEHFGVEISQTVFTLAAERAPGYGPFIRRVRSFDLRSMTPPLRAAATQYEVTILSSALGLKDQDSDAQVEIWRTWARALGFTTDIVVTEPDGDLRENAQAISRYLLSHPHPRRILVTYGPGASEFRSLLGLGTGAADSLAVWINIAGTFNGASYARLKNDSFFEKLKLEVSKYFGLPSVAKRARRFRQLDPRLPAWRSRPEFPAGLQIINVVGVPLRSELPMGLIATHEQLSRELGPNDGAVGIFEAIASPGLIVPVSGMSHRAEAIKLEPIFKRLLAIIAEDAATTRRPEKDKARDL